MKKQNTIVQISPSSHLGDLTPGMFYDAEVIRLESGTYVNLVDDVGDNRQIRKLDRIKTIEELLR